jgi:hypothetical protein
VVAAPADLVDTNVNQPVEPAWVESVGDHPRSHPSDAVLVQPRDPGDRGLVGLGGQERHQIFKVSGEPSPVPGEGHRLDPHPWVGQRNRRNPGARSNTRQRPKSRCRHVADTVRVS